MNRPHSGVHPSRASLPERAERAERNQLGEGIIEACECLKVWWSNSLIEQQFGHFQEAEVVGGIEVISFNSEIEFGTLRSQTYLFSPTLYLWLYLPNAEMTL